MVTILEAWVTLAATASSVVSYRAMDLQRGSLGLGLMLGCLAATDCSGKTLTYYPPAAANGGDGSSGQSHGASANGGGATSNSGGPAGTPASSGNGGHSGGVGDNAAGASA